MEGCSHRKLLEGIYQVSIQLVDMGIYQFFFLLLYMEKLSFELLSLRMDHFEDQRMDLLVA